MNLNGRVRCATDAQRTAMNRHDLEGCKAMQNEWLIIILLLWLWLWWLFLEKYFKGIARNVVKCKLIIIIMFSMFSTLTDRFKIPSVLLKSTSIQAGARCYWASSCKFENYRKFNEYLRQFHIELSWKLSFSRQNQMQHQHGKRRLQRQRCTFNVLKRTKTN